MKRFETSPPTTAVPRASDVAKLHVDFDFADLGPGDVPPLGNGIAEKEMPHQGVPEEVFLNLSDHLSDLPEHAAAAHALHFPDHADHPGVPVFYDAWV